MFLSKYDISLSLLSKLKDNDEECAMQRANTTVDFLHYYDIYPEQFVWEIIDYLCTFINFNSSVPFFVRLLLYMYMFCTRLWINNDIIFAALAIHVFLPLQKYSMVSLGFSMEHQGLSIGHHRFSMAHHGLWPCAPWDTTGFPWSPMVFPWLTMGRRWNGTPWVEHSHAISMLPHVHANPHMPFAEVYL